MNVMDDRTATSSSAPPWGHRIKDWWVRLRQDSPEESEAAARRDDEVNELIEEAAGWVNRRRLETPAVLFLEAHKPFSFLGSQFVAFSAPLVIPLFGVKRMDQFYHLLEKGENVERLIRRIEELTEER